MKKTLYILLFPILALLWGSCADSSEESAVEDTARCFAEKYFTWHFIEARNFATDDMKKQIGFVASNVHKSDLDLLHSTSSIPTIEVSEVSIDNDSCATAMLDMEDVILMDTLGASAHLRKKVKSTLILRKTAGTWKVEREEARIIAE